MKTLGKKCVPQGTQWRCTPLIPALGRQREADLYEFKDSLDNGVSSRTAKDTQRNHVSKSQKLKIKIKETEFKIKPHKDEKYAESLNTVCYCVVFKFFDD